ncbi:MAG TPA: diacylglycerol kinase family lipid kinase [Thermoflexales bacterium]|nr:diacylglycerol kinase family lipid kinase [Anaerolineae bacterium]HQZ52625.1 diacylglycerol kinase family lipid kinase [Thermoflexales bacterium]
MPNVTIIANPAAGHGAAQVRLSALAEALTALGVAAETHQTNRPGHASALAQAAREHGCERLIVAGGDGTVHEVAHGLLSEPGRGLEPAVGILPSGTGSDFVKMLNQPEDIGALARFFLETPPRRIDAARAGDRYMVNTLGIGFDAQVGIQARNLRRDARFLRGPAVYGLALARALLSYRAPPMTIGMDGAAQTLGVAMLTINNGIHSGGSFQLTPGARIDDGVLDACLVPAMSRFTFMQIVPKAASGAHARDPRVRMARAKRFEISSARPFAVQIDGEIVAEATRQLTVEALPGAWQVLG